MTKDTCNSPHTLRYYRHTSNTQVTHRQKGNTMDAIRIQGNEIIVGDVRITKVDGEIQVIGACHRKRANGCDIYGHRVGDDAYEIVVHDDLLRIFKTTPVLRVEF